MSEKADLLRDLIVEEIKSHPREKKFAPTVTYDEATVGGETIVNYKVDLPEEDRKEYSRSFFDSDRTWVENRGKKEDVDLTASLYCKWQV